MREKDNPKNHIKIDVLLLKKMALVYHDTFKDNNPTNINAWLDYGHYKICYDKLSQQSEITQQFNYCIEKRKTKFNNKNERLYIANMTKGDYFNNIKNTKVRHLTHYYQESLKYAIKLKNMKYMAYASFKLGKAAFKSKQFKLGTKHLKKTIDLINDMDEKKRDYTLLAYSQQRLGAVYLGGKRRDLAEKYFKKSIDSFAKSNLKKRDHLIDIMQGQLAYIYHLRGDSKQLDSVVKQSAREYEDGKFPNVMLKIEPRFPDRYSTHTKKFVTARFDVNEGGKAINIKVDNDAPRKFGKVVVEALKKWRFSPRLKEGKRVMIKRLSKRFYFKVLN